MSNLTTTVIAPAAELKAVKPPKAKPIKWTPVPPSGRKIVRLADMVERDAILINVVNVDRQSNGWRVMGAVESRPGDRIVGHRKVKVMAHG